MNYLKQDWKFRTFVITLILIITSLIVTGIEFTTWADTINLQGYSHGDESGEGRNIPVVLMYILPFLKELILIGVPLFLTLMFLKLVGKVKSLSRNKP